MDIGSGRQVKRAKMPTLKSKYNYVVIGDVEKRSSLPPVRRQWCWPLCVAFHLPALLSVRGIVRA